MDLYPVADIFIFKAPNMGRSSKLNSPFEFVVSPFSKTCFVFFVTESYLFCIRSTEASGTGLPELSTNLPYTWPMFGMPLPPPPGNWAIRDNVPPKNTINSTHFFIQYICDRKTNTRSEEHTSELQSRSDLV